MKAKFTPFVVLVTATPAVEPELAEAVTLVVVRMSVAVGRLDWTYPSVAKSYPDKPEAVTHPALSSVDIRELLSLRFVFVVPSEDAVA